MSFDDVSRKIPRVYILANEADVGKVGDYEEKDVD